MVIENEGNAIRDKYSELYCLPSSSRSIVDAKWVDITQDNVVDLCLTTREYNNMYYSAVDDDELRSFTANYLDKDEDEVTEEEMEDYSTNDYTSVYKRDLEDVEIEVSVDVSEDVTDDIEGFYSWGSERQVRELVDMGYKPTYKIKKVSPL